MAGFKTWAEKSSIHGVANAAFSPKPIGKIFWLFLLAGAIGASLYLSREVFIGYINGKKGSSVNVVAMTNREELERIVHLAYCPTDFVDRNKAARMSKTVLQYGLLLIPDLHWTVVEYVYKSMKFTDKEKMIISIYDSPGAIRLHAQYETEKEPVLKWKFGQLSGLERQGNDWSNSSPEGFRKAAEDFKTFMEGEGMTTLDEFLVSIAHDMIYPPRVPYRTTKLLAQYPRYGTLCCEVATQLDLELYAEHSKKHNVPMKTHMMYFDFLHTVPRPMPIEEDVPLDGISMRWDKNPGRIFGRDDHDVSFVNIEDDYAEPRIFLSFATGNHGLNNDYALSIDESNGVHPQEYYSGGSVVVPGFGVTHQMWQFLLHPDVAMGPSDVMDLPQVYQDRYVLRVTLQLTNVWNIEEYYLVGAETLVGGIGGIFGLFMGLSIISLVEMITSTAGFLLEKMNRRP